jgi:preprotein translocase subunit YajC
MQFIPLIVIMGVMWALLILPQQRRAKAMREMLSKLQVGDEVLTAAGIYGEITEFDGQTVFLAVSDNLEIKITRESIAERVVYAEADAEVD